MRRIFLALAVIPMLLSGAEISLPIVVRNKTQILSHLTPSHPSNATAVFLPGDGGWRGAAVNMGLTIASWGYEVYGFDTKKYLEAFSQNGLKLTREEVTGDMRSLAAKVEAATGKPVILVGWSQGAAMAVAAVAGDHGSHVVRGVVTLGLPETAVLGWDWKATLAVIGKREPDQPTFAIKSLLETPSQTPIYMIYGTADEYTSQEAARSLFRAAAQPKQLQEIEGANHRFDGHLPELYHSLKGAMAWLLAP